MCGWRVKPKANQPYICVWIDQLTSCSLKFALSRRIFELDLSHALRASACVCVFEIYCARFVCESNENNEFFPNFLTKHFSIVITFRFSISIFKWFIGLITLAVFLFHLFWKFELANGTGFRLRLPSRQDLKMWNERKSKSKNKILSVLYIHFCHVQCVLKCVRFFRLDFSIVHIVPNVYLYTYSHTHQLIGRIT